MQDGATARVQLPEPHVVDDLATEFAEAQKRIPGAFLFMILQEGGAQTIINVPRNGALEAQRSS